MKVCNRFKKLDLMSLMFYCYLVVNMLQGDSQQVSYHHPYQTVILHSSNCIESIHIVRALYWKHIY
jgi:hypothetical protein